MGTNSKKIKFNKSLKIQPIAINEAIHWLQWLSVTS